MCACSAAAQQILHDAAAGFLLFLARNAWCCFSIEQSAATGEEVLEAVPVLVSAFVSGAWLTFSNADVGSLEDRAKRGGNAVLWS